MKQRILQVAGLLALILCVVAGAAAIRAYAPRLQYWRHRTLIDSAALRYGVDSYLVASVIWQESHYRRDRLGTVGERGFMQVTSNAALEWARSEGCRTLDPDALWDPGTNVMAGTWYLGRALRRWRDKPDPVPYALAEYNAGPSNARRWAQADGNNPTSFVSAITYPQTRRYVERILRVYRR